MYKNMVSIQHFRKLYIHWDQTEGFIFVLISYNLLFDPKNCTHLRFIMFTLFLFFKNYWKFIQKSEFR